MCDLVAPILQVIKFIGGPAKKYFNYHRKFNKYVDDFKQARADLHAREADIQQQLQDENHFGKNPKQEVENWFKLVEEKISHAQGVEETVSKGYYLFRSCLGKAVDEATQEIKEAYAKGQFSNGLVVNDPSTTNVELPTEELTGTTKAEEVYQYLMGDGVRKIGVCGMGGIGKTTIMKHVYNMLLEETKFSKLIWSTVTQSFDIRRLQQEIACQLNENLSDVESTAIRAGKLSEMLRKRGRYVLILDDVWSSFSLREVGILEPTTDNGCKLVLTTRSEEVVRAMVCTKVEVTYLSRDEALQLFLSKVGQDMSPNPTLESIVAECDGLPLAIVTVAGCLRGISDPLVWENALNELRGYIRVIQDMEDKVFGCLRFSYDRLQQVDRDCFLYCALYPEDHEIKKEEIIEHWMEEGLITEMGTRKAMQVSGHSILLKLEENCLLERVGEGTHIKMHDVVRHIWHCISQEKDFSLRLVCNLKSYQIAKNGLKDFVKVSLMYSYISRIPQNIVSPKCQKLTTLLLAHNRLKEIPESFFEHFPNLKILDLSGNPIVELPDSISNLEKLTTLLLPCCEGFVNFPSLSKLQALKKLDIGRTKIREIPHGLEMLVNLRYLNLGFTLNLKEIPNVLLSRLFRLQYLAIHPAPTRAEEMMQLNKLEVFEGCFSNMRDLINYSGQKKRLHKYLIWSSHELTGHFGYIFDKVRHKDYGKKVEFAGIDMNCGDGIILPYDIQQLKVEDCKVESIFSSKCCQLETLEDLNVFGLNNLRVIVEESSECYQMEEIIELEEEGMGTIKYTLPKLRRLELSKLPELKSICSKNEAMRCDSLQNLTIVCCPKLKQIPLYFPLLDKGKASLPPSLKQIEVYPKEWWEAVEWDHPHAKNILLPFLKFQDDEPSFLID
ncbi:hypothetical protein PTKIN_Ptkin14bG0140900 [Pterospermum kingtungense]